MIRDVSYKLVHGKIAGITLGNPKAPVVLCLHGWLDNCASFLPFFDALIEQKSELLNQYQFVAIDWPGHGHSDHRSSDAHYHFIDWCYDLLQLLDVNQWQQITIIGHSMGGMAATLFTSAFNDKVDELILVESIGLLTQNENPSEQLRKGMLSRLQLQQKQTTVHQSVEAAVKARMNVSDLSDNDAKLLVERGLQTVESGVTWRSDARLRNVSPQRFSLKQAIQIVSNLHCPITLAIGENGFDMVQTGVKIFAEHISCYQQYTINGGHHPHMESPKAFIDIVEKALKKN
ncbi:alpha/beta hydrolase [Thalassotalea nanhaiensis]|uniref:Alpha/beta hydrolase n=1 Tax=Thalassotalea nanhaiensis TaxID=3065648 RepID=A0ABY9TMH4_9GAMM|nr:alpha/beta hydrolase [Colwelliaceae bacterium SQ345]